MARPIVRRRSLAPIPLFDCSPDREKALLGGKDGPRLPLGTAVGKGERKYEFYNPPPSEPVLLVSEDRGDTWRLAVSTDF